jgi:hypothetical protein
MYEGKARKKADDRKKYSSGRSHSIFQVAENHNLKGMFGAGHYSSHFGSSTITEFCAPSELLRFRRVQARASRSFNAVFCDLADGFPIYAVQSVFRRSFSAISAIVVSGKKTLGD